MMLSAADSMQSGLLVGLVAFLGVALLLIQLRRHQFRSTTARDLTREQFARLRDQRGIQQSMDQLLLQLEELSRRINAQVDTRFLKLETVIRDADDRIARLEGLLGRRKPAPSWTEGSPDSREPQPPSDLRSAHPSAASAYHEAAQTDASALKATDAEIADTPPDPRIERVHKLADAGKQPIQIAEELDVPLGEVELILNLRDFR